MNNSVFGKTLENIRNRIDNRLISTVKMTQKQAAKPNYDGCTISDKNLIAIHKKKTKLYFISQSILVWEFSVWVNPWYMTFNTIILKLNMGIRQNYSSPTLTLSRMKLKPKIVTKISTPTLRNGLTLVTTQLIIHLELKQGLIVKCLECLRMKLVGSRLLNLLVWKLNFTLTKCLMAPR